MIIAEKPGIHRVSFYTLGCKLNQAETDGIATLFRQHKYQVVPFKEEADLTFINTCTVTAEADAKCRQIIRQAQQASPAGRIVVAGCFPQVQPDKIAALDGIDMILGTREKFNILDMIRLLEGERNGEPLVWIGDMGAVATYDDVPLISIPSRTRAFLKVQDGCDYKCSYCIVPLARGKGRSRALDDCLTEARWLAAEGYEELVLTGVNIGTWEDDQGRFHDLLEAVSDVEGLRRIRISSVEPNLITDELIKLVKQRDNIAPHFHIPMQHASDTVLGAMKRRYRIRDYEDTLSRIVTDIPDAAIGTDVIVGYPGETDGDFKSLVKAIERLPLTYHHIFRYSEREGTTACTMTDTVDPGERKRRSSILRDVSRNRRLQTAQQMLGQVRTVHIEQQNESKAWEGFTDNYLRVQVPLSKAPEDAFLPVELTDYDDPYFQGRLTT
jgi:threonylcarbamoyladenosine tRNA methylthiotransferase MtaB